jgi:hypothetical protein
MTHPDYEAGRKVHALANADWLAGQRSAYSGHPEPNPVWATRDFHLGWVDWMTATVRMTPRERRNASEYRAEVVRAYRSM